MSAGRERAAPAATPTRAVVAALILGKMAQGAERGVRLEVQPGSYLHQMHLDPHDAVTVLGNLIDNAIDAAGETPPPHRVRIAVAIDADTFGVVVDDSGPGLSEEQRRLALQRGWSTKPSADGFGAARIEEEVVVTADGCEVITKFPAEELLVAGKRYLTAGGDLPTVRESQSHLNTAAGSGGDRGDGDRGNGRAAAR